MSETYAIVSDQNNDNDNIVIDHLTMSGEETFKTTHSQRVKL